VYKLFIANKNYSSWSLRPWFLLKGLGIPFDEELVVFEDGSNRARFRRFAPNGTVPCLHDGDTVVWDSLAIVEYLAECHRGVWPESPLARSWARSAASEMHSGFFALRNECPMCCGIRLTLKNPSAALAEDLGRINELFEDGLARFGGDYLAGSDFSAVDAFFGPVAFRVQSYGLELGPIAAQYLAHLREHPAMREWYAAGLAEPWREVLHEEEIAALGTVTADLRAQPAG
jgi:glutathione S-transferase